MKHFLLLLTAWSCMLQTACKQDVKPVILTYIQMPSGTNTARLDEMVQQVEKEWQEISGISEILEVDDPAFASDTIANPLRKTFYRMLIVKLHTPGDSAAAIIRQLNERADEIRDAVVYSFVPASPEDQGKIWQYSYPAAGEANTQRALLLPVIGQIFRRDSSVRLYQEKEQESSKVIYQTLKLNHRI